MPPIATHGHGDAPASLAHRRHELDPGRRATVETPADRIQIIEVAPDEALQYLPEGAG